MKKSFERYVHAVICPIAMLVAIIPFFMDLYNPYFFYCFVVTSPDRGSTAAQFVLQGIYMTSVILCTGVIICMMFRIKCHVTSTTRQSKSYEISSYLTKVKKGTTTSTKRQMQSRRSRRKRKQASEVTTMALLYSVPFIVTWFIPVMWFLCLQISWATSFKIISNGEVLHVVSGIYLSIFVPLQGFINWLIYMRPRLKKVNREVFCRGVLKGTCSSCFQGERVKEGAEVYQGSERNSFEKEEDAEDDDRDSEISDEDKNGDDDGSIDSVKSYLPKDYYESCDEAMYENASQKVDGIKEQQVDLSAVAGCHEKSISEIDPLDNKADYYSDDEMEDEIAHLDFVIANLREEIKMNTLV